MSVVTAHPLKTSLENEGQSALAGADELRNVLRTIVNSRSAARFVASDNGAPMWLRFLALNLEFDLHPRLRALLAHWLADASQAARWLAANLGRHAACRPPTYLIEAARYLAMPQAAPTTTLQSVGDAQ